MTLWWLFVGFGGAGLLTEIWMLVTEERRQARGPFVANWPSVKQQAYVCAFCGSMKPWMEMKRTDGDWQCREECGHPFGARSISQLVDGQESAFNDIRQANHSQTPALTAMGPTPWTGPGA